MVSSWTKLKAGSEDCSVKFNQKPDPQEAAFTMDASDRLYAVIASCPIVYQVPDMETVLVFFVIRRSTGLIDAFLVMKTFQGQRCVSRTVQSKLSISEAKIAGEIKKIKEYFTNEIKAATHFTISWNHLDLSGVADKNEQIKRIEQWNRLNVYKFPNISLNEHADYFKN